MFIKSLPGLGRKWFNPDSLEKKGPNTYQVWEKTVMKKPVNGTRILVSQTRYDVKNGKARTLYLCTFDDRNNMTDHYAVNDVWNKKAIPTANTLGISWLPTMPDIPGKIEEKIMKTCPKCHKIYEDSQNFVRKTAPSWC